MRRIALLLGALGLAACSHNLTLVNRQTGEVGKASVPGGARSGDIEISIGGKTYAGTWVYVSSGGAIGFSSATAVSGFATASGSGTIMAMSTAGGGTILASAADGSTLRCQFQYNQMGNTGIGVCQDNAGAAYDLQIH
jgi:hypothetical protein